MFSKVAIKAGVVRAVKVLGGVLVAGLITQVSSACNLIPAQVNTVLTTIGFPCAGVLGAVLVGLEKTLTWKK